VLFLRERRYANPSTKSLLREGKAPAGEKSAGDSTFSLFDRE
jgi:hypothetical protein